MSVLRHGFASDLNTIRGTTNMHSRLKAITTAATLSLGFVCALNASAAHAQTPASEAATSDQKEKAYQALSAAAEQRAGDPAFDYQLGLLSIDTGRYGEAIIALQRVLAMQPDNAAARAELARAYALAGDIDTARDQFATVVDDPSLPDPVRQRFTGFGTRD
ncbi:MAG: tetratricopeptide repeat protein [Erythrobacter sp.]|nr:tetratricopeptide repeat protein [Erythrobacter sp.]